MRLRLQTGSLHLRPVTNDDQGLLEQIYASTRADELASTGWSPMLQASFVKSQFMAQHLHYRQHFAQGNFQLIELELPNLSSQGKDDQPEVGLLAKRICVGRLYWTWLVAELRLIDIALLPPFQRQGLGSQLVLHLQQLAAAQGLPMSLHVAINNPAINLYQRLGFSVCAGDGMHHQMRWRAAATSSDEK